MEQTIINELEFMALTDPWYAVENFSDEELDEYLPKGMINLEDEEATDWDAVRDYVENLLEVVKRSQITGVDPEIGMYDEELVFKKDDKYYFLCYREGNTIYYTLRDCWENEDFSIYEAVPVEKTITDYVLKEIPWKR